MLPLTTDSYEPITLSTRDLNTLQILLKVPFGFHNESTWNDFRELLALSANKFITASNIQVEECRPANVTFIEILRCPNTWPDNVNCVKVDFAIPLNHLEVEKPQENSTQTPTTNETTTTMEILSDLDEVPNSDYASTIELSTEHLRQMWIGFGRAEFKKKGFNVGATEDECVSFVPRGDH